MKFTKVLLVIFAVMLSFTTCVAAGGTDDPPTPFDFSDKIVKVENTLPFSNGKGINFNGYIADHTSFFFQAQAEIDEAYQVGYELFRLPVGFQSFIVDKGTNKISDEFFTELCNFMDTIEKNYPNMYVVLDNHDFINNYKITFGEGNEEAFTQWIIDLWNQVTVKLGNRYTHLVYELQNESWFMFGADYWNYTQAALIDNIRKTDNTHYIVIEDGYLDFTHTDYFNKENLADKKLIMSYHFYSPGHFTHQNVNNEEYARFTGGEGTINAMINDMNYPMKRANKIGLPVLVGEFGTMTATSTQEDRTLWYEVVAQMFKDANVSWCQWRQGFGPYTCENPETNSIHSVTGAITFLPKYLEAFGLKAPPASDPNKAIIFDDFLRNIEPWYGRYWDNEAYAEGTVIKIGDDTDTHNGRYAVSITNPSRCSLRFYANQYDYKYLKGHGYVYEFWVKAEGNGETISYEAVLWDNEQKKNIYHVVNTVNDGKWNKYTISLADDGWYTAAHYLWDYYGVAGFRFAGNTSATKICFDDMAIVK